MSPISVILSVQFFSLGLIGEVWSRIYYSASGRQPYQIRERVNFEEAIETQGGNQEKSPTILPFRSAA